MAYPQHGSHRFRWSSFHVHQGHAIGTVFQRRTGSAMQSMDFEGKRKYDGSEETSIDMVVGFFSIEYLGTRKPATLDYSYIRDSSITVSRPTSCGRLSSGSLESFAGDDLNMPLGK